MQEHASYCGTFHEGGSYSISLPIPQNSSVPHGALGRVAQSPPFQIFIQAHANAKSHRPWTLLLEINGYAQELNIVFEDGAQAPPPLLAMLGSLTDSDQHTEWQPDTWLPHQRCRGYADPSKDTAKEAVSPSATLPGLQGTLSEHVGCKNEVLNVHGPVPSFPSLSNPTFALPHAKQQKDSDSANPERAATQLSVISPQDTPGHETETLSANEQCPKLGVPLFLAFAAGVACCCLSIFLIAPGASEQPPSPRPAVADVACWQTPQSQSPQVVTPFGARPVGMYGTRTTPCSSRPLHLSMDQITVGETHSQKHLVNVALLHGCAWV